MFQPRIATYLLLLVALALGSCKSTKKNFDPVDIGIPLEEVKANNVGDSYTTVDPATISAACPKSPVDHKIPYGVWRLNCTDANTSNLIADKGTKLIAPVNVNYSQRTYLEVRENYVLFYNSARPEPCGTRENLQAQTLNELVSYASCSVKVESGITSVRVEKKMASANTKELTALLNEMAFCGFKGWQPFKHYVITDLTCESSRTVKASDSASTKDEVKVSGNTKGQLLLSGKLSFDPENYLLLIENGNGITKAEWLGEQIAIGSLL